MLGSVLLLAQALSERGMFWGVKGGVVPFTYLGLALDRGWYRALIWHICRVMWGHQMSLVMHLCVYLDIFIILLLLYCLYYWGFPRGNCVWHSILVKIFEKLRGFTKMGFFIYLVGSNIWIVII